MHRARLGLGASKHAYYMTANISKILPWSHNFFVCGGWPRSWSL